ncbi:MAG: HAD family hydrolase [Candidatus Methanomethyliales bacterium]|nr:HAD family hydrolase [Candidatus Methanomethylicales archaeon]
MKRAKCLRAAVVFDKSGTILKPCRVVLDLQKNETLFHVNTLKFVLEIGGHLVNIKGAINEIKRDSIKIGKVICSSSHVLPRISNEILGQNNVLNALKRVLVEAKRHCGSEVGTCAALIVDRFGRPTHAVGLGGILYEDVRETVETIRGSDDDVFIATGNCRESTLKCARILGIDKRFVIADASPKEKMDFVKKLRRFYGLVVMVGNDINDLPAMREADLSILVKRDPSDVTEDILFKVDHLVSSLKEVPKIISEIKRDVS